MRLSSRLRTVLCCFVLEFGALAGVPMRPDEIRELMHTLAQPKLARTNPDHPDEGDLPTPGHASVCAPHPILSKGKGLSSDRECSPGRSRERCTLFGMTAKTTARPGRNEPCHCGSGRKYKQCCLEKDNAALSAAHARVAADAAAPPAEPVREAAKPTTRHQTEQPWKASASRVYVPRPRGPRKVGGS